MGRTTNTDFLPAGLGHSSVGWVGRYTDLVSRVLAPQGSLRRSSHQALTLLGAAGRVWATALRPDCHTRPVGVTNTQRWGGTHLVGRYVDLVGCILALLANRLRPSDMDSSKSGFMSGAPRPASSSHRRPSSQVAILLGGLGLSPGAWSLKHPFWGECRRGPRNFWSHQVCLSYGPAPGHI